MNREQLDNQVITVGAVSSSGADGTSTLDNTTQSPGAGNRFIVTGVFVTCSLVTAVTSVSIAGVKGYTTTTPTSTIVIPSTGGGTGNLIAGCPLRGKENTDIVATVAGVSGQTVQCTLVGYYTIGSDGAL